MNLDMPRPTDFAIGGDIVNEDLGRRREKWFDVNVGIEGAEIEVAEAARDADRRQHARALPFAQHHRVLEVLIRRSLERPSLRNR